jgi:HNH endonuclease
VTGRPPKPFDYYVRKRADGCWVWTGCKATGYGQIKVDGKMRYAHRISFERTFGAIPEGMLVLHKCDNPACVNPGHLFLGDHTANMRDKVAKNRQARQPGSKNPSAKLTEDDVRIIRSELAEGMMQRTLAERFGVTPSAVSLIARGKKWGHVALQENRENG